MSSNLLKSILAAALSLVAFGLLITSAPGAMRSTKISKNLCETSGGGKFVSIPGFPGERIDRRLLTDIEYLERKYEIFITDGLSYDPVHAANGEHPLGLALDIVPDTANGGSWKTISALAKWAEPSQDQPVAPFRWVGYNGDAGHGRGHHLHLSWNHSDARPKHPAKTVYTLRCPGSKPTTGDGETTGGGKNGGGKNGGTAAARTAVHPGDGGGKDGGGVHPGDGGGKDGGGGIHPRLRAAKLAAQYDALAADPVIETGGVEIP